MGEREADDRGEEDRDDEDRPPRGRAETPSSPPPTAGVDREDDAPLDDEALGLDMDLDLATDGEHVGLDDAVGLDDESGLFEDLSRPDEVVAGDEVDTIPVDLIEPPARGGSMIDDASEAVVLTSDGLDLEELAPLGPDDGGEEGVDADVWLDLPERAPLEQESEGLDEPLDVGFDPARFATTMARRWAREPAADWPEAVDVRVTRLSARPLQEIVVTGPARALAAGAHVLVVEGGQVRELRAPAGPWISIAAAGPQLIALASAEGRVFFSSDGGQTFEASELEVDGPFRLAYEVSEPRLWGHRVGGPLRRSDDLGRTFSGGLLLAPVVAAVARSEGVVVLSAGDAAPTQIACSRDGGARWDAFDAPSVSGPEAPVALALLGSVIAFSEADGDALWLSRDAGAHFVALPGVPAARALALRREDDGLALYAVHASSGGDVVVRHLPDGGEPLSWLDLAEHGEGAEAHALALSESGPLFVATDLGLFVLEGLVEER